MLEIPFILLLLFLYILARSSSLVVENAAKLARMLKIGQVGMGFLFIALATSLPEVAISIISSTAKEGALAAGNVFGANIANILVILGAGAYLYGFPVSRKNLKEIALVLLLSTLITIYIIFRSQVAGSTLGLFEGLLLLAVAGWYMTQSASKDEMPAYESSKKLDVRDGAIYFLLFAISLVAVVLSSMIVVASSLQLAEGLGLSESFMGATIIAVGTSLPEISIALAAIRKKQYGLALGDAIGSCVANLTLVLGIGAVISPISVQLKVFMAALLFSIVANVVFLYIAAVKKKFGKFEGALMLALYAFYIFCIFFLQFGEAGF
ncbi:Sodium/calcium exchanger MaX1 [Candidatus Anstonella stagnisolia]|nr:Sodium/calcium exchanger MaX1 [Candidatus Anstonella stagnisolia]